MRLWVHASSCGRILLHVPVPLPWPSLFAIVMPVLVAKKYPCCVYAFSCDTILLLVLVCIFLDRRCLCVCAFSSTKILLLSYVYWWTNLAHSEYVFTGDGFWSSRHGTSNVIGGNSTVRPKAWFSEALQKKQVEELEREKRRLALKLLDAERRLALQVCVF